MSDVNWAALAPVVMLAAGIVAYSLLDLRRHEVLHLPKWAWGLICVFSIPLGSILYFMVGRGEPIDASRDD